MRSAPRASSGWPCSRFCWERPRSWRSAGVEALLLLDDVLSELDSGRRQIYADRLRAGSQALVTSASRNALPGDPAQTLEVAQSSEGASPAEAA